MDANKQIANQTNLLDAAKHRHHEASPILSHRFVHHAIDHGLIIYSRDLLALL